MIRKIICMLLTSVFLCFSLFSQSQQTGTIKGTVRMADGTKLSGVTVAVDGTGLRTITDIDGTFSFPEISQGRYILVASLDGFEIQNKIVFVQTKQIIIIDFNLELAKLSEEVTITADKPLLSTEETVSTITLTPRQIETLPSLGEKDVFRAFQLLPGISGSNESSSGLYIRGGTPDQNLISYDGFTIYHVDHLFGYFSAFNMEAVSEVRLSKGGYEAKYGGRLSSIMELTGNPGSGDGLHGSSGLSLLSFNGLAETSLFRGKGSFILAGRRSFQSPLYDSILGMFTENAPMRGRFRGGSGGGMLGGALRCSAAISFLRSQLQTDLQTRIS